MGKRWTRSKTLWFNIGTLFVVIGAEFAFLVDFASPEYEMAVRFGLTLFNAVGNMILRTITSEPIGR